MNESQLAYKDALVSEIEDTPVEYWPALLDLIRSYRRGVGLKSAELSVLQGWKEAQQDETLPLVEMWSGIDAE